jgi:hypothetical protein
MTTSENDNLPSGGTENATSLSLDDAANLDFGDPTEDTEEVADEPQSNEEPVEATDDVDQETVEAADDEATAEDAETVDDDTETAEISDDILVPMDDGPVPLKELKAGYMKQADYSRKTMELGNRRRDLEAMSNRVTASVEAVAEFLQSSIPKMPDPGLALTNPGQHYREKTLHDQAMAQVAALIEKANAPKDVLNKLTTEQRTEVLQTENAKLIEAFPTTTTTEGRKQFFEGTTSAAKELGFTDEELRGVTDHRMFKLAHYAKIGLAAEAAKAKAKQKVVNVPPVAPNKRQPGNNANAVRKNQEAMKRLARSGSIHDAMDIDF